MRLKVICQICGYWEDIDVNVIIYRGWVSLRLENIVCDICDIDNRWGDFEIWLCRMCYKNLNEYMKSGWDDYPPLILSLDLEPRNFR